MATPPTTHLAPGTFAYYDVGALGFEAVRELRKEPYGGDFIWHVGLVLKPGGEYEISFQGGVGGRAVFGERGVWRLQEDKLRLQRYRGRRGGVSEWGSSEWGRDPDDPAPGPSKPPPQFRVARVLSPDAILLPWWGGFPWEFLLRRRIY